LDLILTIGSETAKAGESGILSASMVLPARQNPNMEKWSLPLAYEQHCTFQKHLTDSLDAKYSLGSRFYCSKLY